MRMITETRTDVIKSVSKKFRAQPIIDSKKMKVCGIELLNRSLVNFSGEEMLQADICAVIAASKMAEEKIFNKIHFNAEISSILNPDWIQEAVYHARSGMVLEVVERNNLLEYDIFLKDFLNIIKLLRCFGIVIAMDDVTPVRREIELVDKIKPEIIKVDHPTYINGLKKRFPESQIVLERVETKEEATQSLNFGVDYFQGYYYDLLFERSVPKSLTPPGVMSRYIKSMLKEAA